MPERPYPYERDLDAFDHTVAAAEREVALQVRLALHEDLQQRSVRLLQLAAVLAILGRLGTYTDPQARELVRAAHEQGAERADTLVREALPDAEPAPAAGIYSEAIAELEESVTDRLRASRETVGRQARDVFAKASRRASLVALFEGPDDAARLMRRELQQEGVAAFIDRSGRAWSLEAYTSMAVRTTTREAVIQGSLERYAAHGVTLLRWSEHGDACPICKPWLGKLVSLTGRHKGATAIGDTPGIPAHPNCKCSWLPVAADREPATT